MQFLSKHKSLLQSNCTEFITSMLKGPTIGLSHTLFLVKINVYAQKNHASSGLSLNKWVGYLVVFLYLLAVPCGKWQNNLSTCFPLLLLVHGCSDKDNDSSTRLLLWLITLLQCFGQLNNSFPVCESLAGKNTVTIYRESKQQETLGKQKHCKKVT